ncbi:hypothetical protein [Methylobacterium sp. sgz302541]|uniref:hypothetical protein n=1 Tax=unclassified Methylobacterium TaxID=2615210 RepID=UPI003D325FEE
MSDHHKHASAAVARTLFDGMPAAERAEVQAEADREGVGALEIVRRSLDILIAETGTSPTKGLSVTRADD